MQVAPRPGGRNVQQPSEFIMLPLSFHQGDKGNQVTFTVGALLLLFAAHGGNNQVICAGEFKPLDQLA